MDRLAAVRFNNASKYYYFSTRLDLHKGDKVVVETVRGLELGELISELKDTSEFTLETELKPIIRMANHADLEVYGINQIRAEQAFDICKQIISESELDMHLISCEYTLDASKIIFMYTSDERVDFRELLKKLAAEFKCRIELRQVGPRDKAKIIGGIGNCGLPLCCSSFLGEFDGISINMAKNQLLAINIDKISGACGRLLCCLKYEDEAYKEIKKKFPKIGTRTVFDNKNIKVVGLNVLNDLVKIDESGNISFITLEEFNAGKPLEKVVEVKPVKEVEDTKQKVNPRHQQKKTKTNEKQSQKQTQKQKQKQNDKSNRNKKTSQKSTRKKETKKTVEKQPKQTDQKKDNQNVKDNKQNKRQNKSNKRQTQRQSTTVKTQKDTAQTAEKTSASKKNNRKKRYYNNRRRGNSQKGKTDGQS